MSQSGIATALGWRGRDPNSLEVPAAPNVDPSEAAGEAIAGNIKNLPAATSLGRRVDKATTDQYLAWLDKMGLGGINSKVIENIKSLVSGELPSDVRNLISRSAAEKGIVRGTSGSEFDQYGELRDLGLTSLEVTNKGLDAASRWIAQTNANAPRFNFSSMFISPAQQIATQQWNEVNRYNAQFLRNQIKMLPSNAEMAGAQVLDYISTFATTAASYGTKSAMGSGGGGGGGGSEFDLGADEYGGNYNASGGYGYNSAAGTNAGRRALRGY